MKDPIPSYYAKCLQTDLPGAIRILKSQAKGTSSKRTQAFLRKVEGRFLSKRATKPVHCSDQLVAQVVHAYRAYYREALLNLSRRESFEQDLEAKIHSIGKEHNLRLPKASWKSVEAALEKEFRKRGYRALFGRVSPFRSLLVWKSEKKKTYQVPLLSGSQRVSVVFLDGFIDLGWLHYATFGRYYVGGWAKKNALYCVFQAYKRNLKSEAFRVSYLAHEAQHFSDYKRFPGLSQRELEYRAKLAELIASRRPARLMKKFAAEAKNDPSLPHCHAAFGVLQNIGTHLKGRAVSAQARQCLLDHSAQLPPRKRLAS